MIDQAFDTVLEFILIHLFPPKTARDWAFAIFMVGLIWYLAFGTFIGWSQELTQVGLFMMLGVVLISTVVLLAGAFRRRGTRTWENPND